MDEDFKDGQEVHKTPEGDSAPSTEEEVTLTVEEIADLRKKADASSQNHERAKKAEAEVKELKKLSAKEEKKDDFSLSAKDNLALIRAEVEDEDLDEVLDYARFKKITVSEALKTPYLKSRLAEAKQERATALATQTKGGNRETKKETGEALLERAHLQNLPDENDDEGIEKLAGAHLATRFKQR